MLSVCQRLDRAASELGEGIFRQRLNLVRKYVLGLDSECLAVWPMPPAATADKPDATE
jgi:hypothetical protein